MEALAILLGIIALLLFVFVAQGVKIIRPYERGLVERLGKIPGDGRPRPADAHPVCGPHPPGGHA